MNTSAESHPLRTGAILRVLDLHLVDYLVVGGVAANAYGASRLTQDLDCVVDQRRGNLVRLAEALQDLGARLRVEGMTDEESAALGIRPDAVALERMRISTWRTDEGDFDVLVELPAAGGRLAAIKTYCRVR